MTTTPAAPRRRITNRRMFVIMLGRALARRRSRALAAIGSSAVGAATLFCLAAVCLAIPAQMNAQMRQFGANLILVPLQGDSGAATAGPAATPSAAPQPSAGAPLGRLRRRERDGDSLRRGRHRRTASLRRCVAVPRR